MKIYVSSTYKDLAVHREAVYRQLRKMRHDVIAMEDYVAVDQRPLDKCLEDVATADVYVGLFAWRYGFVPTRGNPDQRSVTEFEYRKALELKKPCLIFLATEDAPWPANMMDSQTGESDYGACIRQLRAELADNHTVTWFSTADRLAADVGAAIYGIHYGSEVSHERRLLPAGERRPRTGARATLRKKYPKLWTPGGILRVRFIGGDKRRRRAVQRFAPLWSAYANLHFEFGAHNEAEILVAFDSNEGNWSYLGTDALAVPMETPTLNIAWLDDPEARVLHEFGHVVGLLDEHHNPKAKIPWNKELVYKSMGGPPNFWSPSEVDRNVFAKWDPSLFPHEKPFDAASIMTYWFPNSFTGRDLEIGHKGTLSSLDKEFAGILYPYD